MEMFQFYFRRMKSAQDGQAAELPHPTSFWIRKAPSDEQALTELAQHLNFFSRYFDRRAPMIMVHDDPPPASEERTIRFPFDSFPEVLTGQDLDPYLLSLWHTAIEAPDAFRKYLYLYQILEFAAFYYLQEQTFNAVRKAVVSPDSAAKPREAARKILDALVEDKAAPNEKLNSVIEQLVDPELVWNEITACRQYFSSPVEFDGGVTIPALIKERWTLDDWKGLWIPKFPDNLRKLRNALAHAREARQAASLAPTRSNYERLKLWLPALEVTAMQVMVFRV